MSTFAKNFLFVVVILFAIAFILSGVIIGQKKPQEYTLSAFVSDLRGGRVETVLVKPTEYEVVLKGRKDSEGRPLIVKKETTESFGDIVSNYKINPETFEDITIKVVSERGVSYWFAVLGPIVIPVIIIGLFIFFMGRQVQGANTRAMMFGQSTAREVLPGKDKELITFKAVAGNREAKVELQEIVEFLKDPKKFIDMGAKIPKGLLLMGPPGTGKTLMARAVAGEASVPFLHMSGSEFVEMFVGVGASRVRDLFRRAKKLAPAIVFIDEIDAVGRRRGAGLGGSHDEREQTLNQILVEMDGFEPNSGVIVVAATNRPDVLDSALLRPGRFDRRVTLDMPDINEREEILNIHVAGKKIDENVRVREIAERTPGFSGADIANLINEAAILAVRRDKSAIGKIEMFESIEKVLLGPERRSRVFSSRERLITALHEAGHALVAHSLPYADPVRKVSIVSRGHAGGYTLKMPTEDKHYHTRAEFIDDLAVALGGYVTEKMIFGQEQISTGPSSDLRNATNLARKIVTDYGMSFELGPRTFGVSDDLIFLGKEITEHRDYSEKASEKIDEEVMKFIRHAEAEAMRIVGERRSVLETIAQKLLEKETLEQDEFAAIAGKKAQAPDDHTQELMKKISVSSG